MYCSHCGNEIDDTSVFCEYCGNKVGDSTQVSEDPQGASEVLCPRCNAKNASGSAYCAECGFRLNDEALSEEGSAVPEPERPSDLDKTTVEPPSVTARVPQNERVSAGVVPVRNSAGRRSSRTQNMGTVAVVAGGLLAGIALAFLLAKRFQPVKGPTDTSADISVEQQGPNEGGEVAEPTATGQAKLVISESDLSGHPNVLLFIDARDAESNPLVDLDASSFAVEEIAPSGESIACRIVDVSPVSKGGSTYKLTYETVLSVDSGYYMTVKVACSETSGLVGTAETTYRIPEQQTHVTPSPVTQTQVQETPSVPEPQQTQTTAPAAPTNAGEYVLPDSSTRYYTEAELSHLSNWELEIARNEIYARYGRGFRDSELQYYFDSCSWYTRRYDPDEFDAMPTPLNQVELANVKLISSIEDSR